MDTLSILKKTEKTDPSDEKHSVSLLYDQEGFTDEEITIYVKSAAHADALQVSLAKLIIANAEYTPKIILLNKTAELWQPEETIAKEERTPSISLLADNGVIREYELKGVTGEENGVYALITRTGVTSPKLHDRYICGRFLERVGYFLIDPDRENIVLLANDASELFPGTPEGRKCYNLVGFEGIDSRFAYSVSDNGDVREVEDPQVLTHPNFTSLVRRTKDLKSYELFSPDANNIKLGRAASW